MFEIIKPAKPDPILGLTEKFNLDNRSNKINLSVGIYQDSQGQTPTFDSVRKAEEILLQNESDKSYKPIIGDEEFGLLVKDLVLGKNITKQRENTAKSIHTPGGTGALRVVMDYFSKFHQNSVFWISKPSWPNHKQIINSTNLNFNEYAYFNSEDNQLNFNSMINDLSNVKSGDVVLLHGCCHNPTGIDLNQSQWETISDLLLSKKAIPLIDFAYQGFGDGLNEDSEGLRKIVQKNPESIICSSFSKNFGLYSERVGSLTILSSDNLVLENVVSQMKVCIRSNYSNPPSHGVDIVKLILSNPTMRKEWEKELSQIRNRMKKMRNDLVLKLHKLDSKKDFSFIKSQRGMFSISGLDKEQVNELREKYAIYIVDSGRINIAGINSNNIDRLSESIVSVIS
ncbi:MAG: aromatic amino acid aminotransferase [Dehalococcoidia bacterium]|nr:aromatic amino acid aminotransferase [Dehalococcoidia bacterium]